MHTDEQGFVFRRRIPAPPLSDYVAWFWYFEGLRCDYDRERVLPDGSCELVINLQDVPRHRFDPHDPGRNETFQHSWISGAQTKYLVIDVLQNSSMIGVHFQPGGISPFVPGGAAEVGGKVVEADAVWGLAAIDLCDALRNAPSPDLKFSLLEEFLFRRLRHRWERHPAIVHALRRFTADPHQGRIDQVVGETGLSHKQFIECFRREVGLTPKRYCRIRRFQRVLDEIHAGRPVNWTELALAGGYFDQAHFINEFRVFSGLNPRAYLRDAGEYRNFVPLRG
jgi:AraC-like DNA-binding protein